jgi:purine-binding chemotaxis protein CheW
MFIPPPATSAAAEFTPPLATVRPRIAAITPPQRETCLQLLSFHIGEHEYALPINVVQEISRALPITRVDACPRGVEGLIHLRGQGIALVDLHARFGIEAGPASGQQRIIIAELNTQGAPRLLALAADRVNRVLRLPTTAVGPSLAESVPGRSAILGTATLDTGTMHLLSLDQLLDEHELTEAYSIASAA